MRLLRSIQFELGAPPQTLGFIAFRPEWLVWRRPERLLPFGC